jgi:hypothetical protein
MHPSVTLNSSVKYYNRRLHEAVTLDISSRTIHHFYVILFQAAAPPLATRTLSLYRGWLDNDKEHRLGWKE